MHAQLILVFKNSAMEQIFRAIIIVIPIDLLNTYLLKELRSSYNKYFAAIIVLGHVSSFLLISKLSVFDFHEVTTLCLMKNFDTCFIAVPITWPIMQVEVRFNATRLCNFCLTFESDEIKSIYRSNDTVVWRFVRSKCSLEIGVPLYEAVALFYYLPTAVAAIDCQNVRILRWNVPLITPH